MTAESNSVPSSLKTSLTLTLIPLTVSVVPLEITSCSPSTSTIAELVPALTKVTVLPLTSKVSPASKNISVPATACILVALAIS